MVKSVWNNYLKDIAYYFEWNKTMTLDTLDIFINNFLNERTDESSNLPNGRYIQLQNDD